MNLRVHRIVAPDPDKHIPGWVELCFEPKEKATPEKPNSDKPTNEKPAGTEASSKTKSENKKDFTEAKPKPR